MLVAAQVALVVADRSEVDLLVDVDLGARVGALGAVEALAGRLAVDDQLLGLLRVLDVVAQTLHIALDVHEQVDDPHNRHQVQKREERLLMSFNKKSELYLSAQQDIKRQSKNGCD